MGWIDGSLPGWDGWASWPLQQSQQETGMSNSDMTLAKINSIKLKALPSLEWKQL